jgi:hypothetical protein
MDQVSPRNSESGHARVRLSRAYAGNPPLAKFFFREIFRFFPVPAQMSAPFAISKLFTARYGKISQKREFGD